MTPDQVREFRIRQTQRSAQVASLVFGIALLLWGVAPAVVQRVVSGRPPTAATFAASGLTIILGLAFLALGVLIGRTVVWAIWTSLVLGCAVLLLGLATALFGSVSAVSLFPMLLAACVAGTCWIALDVRRGYKPVTQAGEAA